MRTLLIALAGSASLLAGCSMTEGRPVGPDTADLTPEARGPFVMMAGSSDLYEIQSGRMAQQRSRRNELRQFGQTLVAHHTQTTQQVMAAARESGMNPPPPALMPMHRNMLDRLQRATGPAFDRMFVRQQIRAHEMALALHQNYARAGDAAPLRRAASGAVPVVSQHLARARQLD
jgi:putative membrane protein